MNETPPEPITAERPILQEFRDDLKSPEIQFGRCAVTGEWGKVVAIDLGALAFEHPDFDNGVEYDPDTKEVTFTKWRPIVHQSQVSLSEGGLEKVLSWMRNQASPVPSVTPNLVYQWLVRYEDGHILSQFCHDPETEGEIEHTSREIDYSRNVIQCEILPRDVSDTDLPKYALDLREGTFFKDGVCINAEIDYEGIFDPEQHKLVYMRKVMATFGSRIRPKSMARDIALATSAVNQLLGWSMDGKGGFLRENEELPCCVISIDDYGMWRAYRQV